MNGLEVVATVRDWVIDWPACVIRRLLTAAMVDSNEAVVIIHVGCLARELFDIHDRSLNELYDDFDGYGGAAGTLASLRSGNEGIVVRNNLTQETGLHDPAIARDGFAEIINNLAVICGTLGKLAFNLIIMSSNELGEVMEPFVPHRGASSTILQKRNPISIELMLAASKVLRTNAGLALEGMDADFERTSGPWHLEWVAVPESFVVTVGALSQAEFVLSGLTVDRAKLLENLNSTRGLIVAEAVMRGLAPHTGRQEAHGIVYEACKSAIQSGAVLHDVLKSTEAVPSVLSEKDIVDEELDALMSLLSLIRFGLVKGANVIKPELGEMALYYLILLAGIFACGSLTTQAHMCWAFP
ncbi:3-carboxy-cis,cis-muconate cycloisomerase [Fusarium austroafricanum]|uniref:3-carboxy-cis,cis-muconate cycloisomerase n=1 Tax=Fusarium austroafricanum TaxID=2364996 RepID=A0A8H4KJV1_9HYPO|nr:3-carboxy-cis,cis-muconate cycloisomerase [Fusarium austroafricanum]